MVQCNIGFEERCNGFLLFSIIFSI